MFYKNISYSAKTFHGVTFQPGETKEVGDYINNPLMLLVDKPIQPVIITEQKKPSSDIVCEEAIQVDDVPPEKEANTPAKKSNKEKASNKEQESN